MKAVYKMNIDCGRMGQLEGIFVEDKEMVQVLIDNEVKVYFGEVLGKHSEIFGSVDKEEISMVTDQPDVVEIIEEYELKNGFNPFEYEAMDSDSVEGIYEEGMYVRELCEALIKNR